MNERIKHLIKKAIFAKQKESNIVVYHAILSDATLELSNAISFSKAKYHERLAVKFNDPKTLLLMIPKELIAVIGPQYTCQKLCIFVDNSF